MLQMETCIDHIYDPTARSEFSLHNNMAAIIQGGFGGNRLKKKRFKRTDTVNLIRMSSVRNSIAKRLTPQPTLTVAVHSSESRWPETLTCENAM